jgi:hypothetical protein
MHGLIELHVETASSLMLKQTSGNNLCIISIDRYSPCLQGLPRKPKLLLEFECLSTVLNPQVHIQA